MKCIPGRIFIDSRPDGVVRLWRSDNRIDKPVLTLPGADEHSARTNCLEAIIAGGAKDIQVGIVKRDIDGRILIIALARDRGAERYPVTKEVHTRLHRCEVPGE